MSQTLLFNFNLRWWWACGCCKTITSVYHNGHFSSGYCFCHKWFLSLKKKIKKLVAKLSKNHISLTFKMTYISSNNSIQNNIIMKNMLHLYITHKKFPFLLKYTLASFMIFWYKPLCSLFCTHYLSIRCLYQWALDTVAQHCKQLNHCRAPSKPTLRGCHLGS